MTNHQLHTLAGIYRWHETWVVVPGQLDYKKHSGRTHGVVITQSSRLYVFHQADPAMLVYDMNGHFIESWGDYPGAHGLTLVEEEGEEFLWLTDEKRVVVEKTTIDGRVAGRITPPPYADHEPYIPTWVAVNETRHGGDGNVWVADGYGSNRVSRYDALGNYLSTLDGEEGAGRFCCPHGIWFDSRKRPMELYVADRGNRRVQVYDEEGHFLRSFGENFLTSPDGFAADGERLIIPELRGRITILDASDGLICHVGNNESICADSSWPDSVPLFLGKFNSPHAAARDAFGNLYVVEWRVGGRILKLEKGV